MAVRQHYGQTEHGMLLGNWQCGGDDSDGASLGTALQGQRLELRDDGTLHVRRNGPLFWFPGYWGLPAPAGDSVATGDLFRRLADGSHRYEGRADDVIKASGFRVGPCEVEEAILSRAGEWGVEECAAVQIAGHSGGGAVGAVLVQRRGAAAAPGLAAVQEQVRSVVGQHAVPRQLRVVHEPLPRTLSGKVLRKPLASLF